MPWPFPAIVPWPDICGHARSEAYGVVRDGAVLQLAGCLISQTSKFAGDRCALAQSEPDSKPYTIQYLTSSILHR